LLIDEPAGQDSVTWSVGAKLLVLVSDVLYLQGKIGWNKRAKRQEN
jgi:hypothetical protein